MNPVRTFHYVYVLQKKEGLMYTGYTSDLKKRVLQHNEGKSSYTKKYIPYTLIYYEACLNKSDAFAGEKYLKSGIGKKYLKNRIKENISEGVLTG